MLDNVIADSNSTHKNLMKRPVDQTNRTKSIGFSNTLEHARIPMWKQTELIGEIVDVPVFFF